MIEKIKYFMRKAGKYAVENQKKANQHLLFKSGGEAVKGIVTDTDLTISKMFKSFVEQNFSDMDYMIIDEESISSIQGDIFEQAQQKEYLFVLDPIDGTMNYAAGEPLYGITIGVMKDGKPWLGCVYSPAEDILIYNDEDKVYCENKGEKSILSPNVRTLSKIVQGHAWEIKLKPDHKDGELLMTDIYSAVAYFIYIILGRIRAAFCIANLWDIAGSWAILEQLGMGLFQYESGQKMDAFTPEFFLNSCRLKEMMIIGYEDDFATVKGLTLGLTEA